MNPAVHVLVFEGFADWEPAYALAELRRSGGLDVVTLGFTDAPVRSMGGLRVVPDRAMAELRAREVPIAAICGATLALAHAGLLNDRAHTSNEQAYLTSLAPEYAGGGRYVDTLAVRDRGVITASGLGPTEFAREIFEELEVFTAEERPVWYHLFKHGRFPQ